MRHPLHPALVHFPIACWTIAVVADLASLWIDEPVRDWSSGSLGVGCAMALPAILAGLLELPRVPDGRPLRDAYWHMGAMLLACTLFTARLLLGLGQSQALPPGAVALCLDIAGFTSLAAGGWLGGRLVYGHGIGTGAVTTTDTTKSR